MNQARDRLRIPSLTILQMMKLVVLGAVASACLAFGVRLAGRGVGGPGPWFLIIWEGLGMPLALAFVAFPLLRRGQLKDWLIRSLVATSMGIAFGVVLFIIIMFVGEQMSRRGQRPDPSSVMASIFAFILYGLVLLHLLKGIVPARCPDCRRLLLLPDAKSRVRAEVSRGRSYQCLGCRGRFQKIRGVWEAIPTVIDPMPDPA